MASETSGVVALPAGLGEQPPDGVLAGLLADVSVARVSGFDTVELAAAAYRQATHSRAVFLRAVAESGMRAPGSAEWVERVDSPGEFSSDEVRAALVWSRTRAESTFWFAHTIFVLLPLLGEQMLAGVLDEPRAKAFADWTAGLSDEHAQKVCDELVTPAPSLLVGQLIDEIKRLAIALDPEWAERKYREAVTGRRVESWQGPNGTANLAGRDLPAERAQAGSARIDALARSIKTAGDHRPADAIRADLFLGMLDGQFTGMTDDEIIAHVLAHPVAAGDSDMGEQNTATEQPAAIEQPAATEPEAAPGPETAEDTCERPVAEETPGEHSADEQKAGVAWNVRELRAELSTLLGLDKHPAELPGFGYIPASVAMSMLPGMVCGQWRFVICHEQFGTAICSGATTARPTLVPAVAASPSPRGRGIVELQLTASQLTAWQSAVNAGQHGAWARVIRAIARRVDAAVFDHTGCAPQDYDARVARAGLRRWIEIRDRYCLHPACRMPASRSDQDHRVDYAAGGPTSEANLDSVCRHDHRLIHDGGWSTSRTGSDEIIWTSALGHTHTSRPPPVMMAPPEADHGAS